MRYVYDPALKRMRLTNLVMKECPKCKVVKGRASYWKDPEKEDGHSVWCKSCMNKNNLDRHGNDFGLVKKPRDEGKYFDENNDGYRTRGVACNTSPIHRAHRALDRAIKAGKIVRPKICECCKKQAHIEAHHPDYNKPLLVHWLCSQCHTDIHKSKGRGKNANSAEKM